MKTFGKILLGIAITLAIVNTLVRHGKKVGDDYIDRGIVVHWLFYGDES